MPVVPRGSTRHPPPRIPFQGYGPSDDYLPPHRPATPSRSVIAAGGEWAGGSRPRGASGRDVSPDRPPPLPVAPQPPRRPQQGAAPTSPPPLPSHTPGTLPGDRFVIPHHPLDPNSTAAAAAAASAAAGVSYEQQQQMLQQQQQHPNLYHATPRQQPSQAPSQEYRAAAAQEQEWGEFRPASLPREEGTGVAYTDDLGAMEAEDLRLALSQERAMHDELRDRFARMVAVTQTKLSEIRREFQEKEAENATLRAMLADGGGGSGTPGGQQQQAPRQQVEPPHAYTYSPAPAATPGGGGTPRGKRRTSSSRRPRKAGLPPEARGWQSPPQSPHQQQRYQQQQQQHPGMRRGAHITTPPHRRLQTGSRIELGSPQESRWQHYG